MTKAMPNKDADIKKDSQRSPTSATEGLTTKSSIPDPELAALREQLAAIEHERWANWQRYCHEVIRANKHDLETTLGWWDRQIALPYSELTDKEKASDMEQVDRYWPLIEQYLAAHHNALLEECKRNHAN